MNSVWKSIATIWNSLSVGQRVMLGAVTGLTVAILIGLIWWSQKPQLSLLAAGLDPVEAAKIADELRDQKIPFEITGAGKTIYVPDSMVYELRLKLFSKGVLKASGQSGVGFELFDKPQFGMSDFMQKASYYRALQGEIARTITQMDGVEAARVFIVVPNDRLFTADKSEAKASVFLTLNRLDPLTRQQINAIRFLVANGVEGLKPSRVTISDNNGGVLAEPDDETGNGSGMTSAQLEIKRNVETIYTKKVQSMLDQVLGMGQSVVRTTIDMSFDNVTETKEQFDPTTVLRTESTNVEDSENSTPSTGGIAGTGGNIPGASTNLAARSEAASIGKSKKQITNNQYEIGKTVQNTLKGVGDIKKVSVAVVLNLIVGQDGKPTPRTKEEKAKLENVIKKAVGAIEEKGKRMDEIGVEEVAFAPQPQAEAMALSPAKQLTDSSNYDKYFTWAKNIGLVLLALYLLSFFHKMLSESKSERLRTELNLDEIMEGDKVDRKSQNITVGELSKLIRENPNNMAQSLKNWLGPT
jgi:flagellar M-ring protein FliF